MIRNLRLACMFALATFALPGLASANFIYSYTGNSFDTVTAPYTTSMSLSGSFELSTAIPANANFFAVDAADLASFSFSDGVSTYTDVNAVWDDSSGTFSTDGAGNIVGWFFQIDNLTADTRLSSAKSASESDVVFDISSSPVDLARNIGSPGSWAVVPEPSTALLLGGGLLALGVRGRRRGRAGSAD